jgi:hypothetical protein
MLARLLATAARGMAPVDIWRAPLVPAPVMRRIGDPLRCPCPECLVLDARFPNEGYQLALFPYVLSKGVA